MKLKPWADYNIPMRKIIALWWPLAASWLLMGFEQPLQTIVIARLADPEINLAAYGGVVYSLSLIIEAPIIMLLAASTALCKDWPSFVKVRGYMMGAGAALTGLHILVAFTPLSYFVIRDLIGAPAAVIEPARIGLMIMTPWTWSIAYRRFHQGVLIRFGRSRTVGVGTIVRLLADGLVLGLGYGLGNIPGIVVASSAVAAGVVSEAVYAGLAVRPVLRCELRNAPISDPALTFRTFIAFYVPLVLTSLLSLLANPIGSAAISRMPEALASLAAWSVVASLVFILRSFGYAYNEVVVAMLDEPNARANLNRFTVILAVATTLGLLLIAATPLAKFWFGTISGLEPHLVELARRGLWIALPLPALSAWQSWYQGIILNSRKTRGISEAVILYLITSGAILGAGVIWGQIPGLYVGLAALSLSVFVQTVWLGIRSQNSLRSIERREAATGLSEE